MRSGESCLFDVICLSYGNCGGGRSKVYISDVLCFFSIFHSAFLRLSN